MKSILMLMVWAAVGLMVVLLGTVLVRQYRQVGVLNVPVALSEVSQAVKETVGLGEAREWQGMGVNKVPAPADVVFDTGVVDSVGARSRKTEPEEYPVVSQDVAQSPFGATVTDTIPAPVPYPVPAPLAASGVPAKQMPATDPGLRGDVMVEVINRLIKTESVLNK